LGLEKELKFPVTDCRDLLPVVSRTARSATPWHFESNLVLDTSDRALFRRGELLRLRTGTESVLTFKAPCAETGSATAKIMEELETGISDLPTLHTILHRLGFTRELRYEKFRAEWKLDTALICLDILPFGHFVEIEGEEPAIAATAEILGLPPATARRADYHRLFREHLAASGREPEDSFVFTDRQRETWMRKLRIAL